MLGILLLLVILAICVAIVHIRQVQARTWADQVIAGSRQAPATEINKYITQLTTTVPYAWLFGQSEQDQQRIDQLRNIRNALIAKHH